MLNDDDLAKISQRIRSQGNTALKRLRLPANDFKEPWSFIELINDVGQQFTHLDFSKMEFSVP